MRFSEERPDESVLRGYMNSMDVRRVKFGKDQKKKIHNFYRDLRKYLEEAYFKFEIENADKGQELTSDRFLEFNKAYRNIYSIKTTTKDKGFIH